MPYQFNPFTGNFDYYQAAGSASTPAWQPTALDSLALWLDANYGVTTSAGKVTTWVSRDQNGMTFTQAGGSAQPTLVANQINGLPIVRFNGSTTYLTADLSQPLMNTAGYDIFLVMKHNGFIGSPNYQAPISLPDSSDGNAGWVLFSNDASYSDISLGGGIQSGAGMKSGSLSLDTTNFHTFRVAYNGSGLTTAANYFFFKDTTQGTSAASGGFSTPVFSTPRIGSDPAAQYFINADIAAALVFKGKLSVANLALVKTFINTTYGI